MLWTGFFLQDMAIQNIEKMSHNFFKATLRLKIVSWPLYFKILTHILNISLTLNILE